MDPPEPRDAEQRVGDQQQEQQRWSPPVIVDLDDNGAKDTVETENTQKTATAKARDGQRQDPAVGASVYPRSQLRPQSQGVARGRMVRKRKRVLDNGKSVDVIEVHHHHHHVHPPTTTAAAPADWGNFPPAAYGWAMPDPAGDIHPIPIGAGTWGNPVPQISYQQPTAQNQFTIILGCIVCPVATFICIVIWLAVFGIIELTDVFGNPW